MNKRHELNVELSKIGRVDCLCITELWFQNNKPLPLQKLVCADFLSRSESRGGGTAIYLRNGISFSVTQELKDLAIEGIFEISAVLIKQIDEFMLRKPLVVISVYRPSNPLNNTLDKLEIFFSKIEILFDWLSNKQCSFLMAGDFNLAFFNPTDPNVIRFDNLLKSINSSRVFLSEPTRITKKSKTPPDNCVTNIDYRVALN